MILYLIMTLNGKTQDSSFIIIIIYFIMDRKTLRTSDHFCFFGFSFSINILLPYNSL